MAGRIWIDVEDLFLYISAYRRPSGIQRLARGQRRDIIGKCGNGEKQADERDEVFHNELGK